MVNPATYLRQQIPRWINASIMKYLEVPVKDYNPGKCSLLVQTDITPDIIKQNDQLVVVWFDGPDLTILGPASYRYPINYTLVASTTRKGNDMYAHQRLMGLVLTMFPACIPVYRYGSGDSDTGALVGILQQVTNPLTFGAGSPTGNLAVDQSSVSAQYRMDYYED